MDCVHARYRPRLATVAGISATHSALYAKVRRTARLQGFRAFFSDRRGPFLRRRPSRPEQRGSQAHIATADEGSTGSVERARLQGVGGGGEASRRGRKSTCVLYIIFFFNLESGRFSCKPRLGREVRDARWRASRCHVRGALRHADEASRPRSSNPAVTIPTSFILAPRLLAQYNLRILAKSSDPLVPQYLNMTPPAYSTQLL